LKKARPPEGRASFGKLHLWRFLRKASPLAGWRFLKEARLPSASFGKLHLWRGTCVLPKEGKKLHLWREGRPSLPSLSERSFTSGASFRRKGVLPPEVKLPEGSETSSLPSGRASFASFGFLNVLREASPLAASFGKRGTEVFLGSCVLKSAH